MDIEHSMSGGWLGHGMRRFCLVGSGFSCGCLVWGGNGCPRTHLALLLLWFLDRAVVEPSYLIFYSLTFVRYGYPKTYGTT